jgi:hypothetical protein
MPIVTPGNWYFFVDCKQCHVPVAIGEAQAPEDVIGSLELNHGPLSIHCNGCGADRVYLPQDISARKVGFPQ